METEKKLNGLFGDGLRCVVYTLLKLSGCRVVATGLLKEITVTKTPIIPLGNWGLISLGT